MKWLIVTGTLHCEEIGSGGVNRVGTSGCGRGSVVGLCEDGTKHLGSIEGGQCVDKLSNFDPFSEDSVGRHVVILFLHKL